VKLSRGRERFHNQLCVFCQQAAEKYLKALIQELGLVASRTHNLRSLQSQLLGYHDTLRSLGRGLDFLTRFAVDTRYPGDDASKRQAAAALRWAERVRAAVRTLLKLPLHPPRRKK
jgi:HEPN domain-containing protein